MNPRAMDTDTLLGLVRTGAPLRQTAEEMAGRRFTNDQEATMFLQSRLSGRGEAGVQELLNAIDRRSGGSAKALGRTTLESVGQRVSESAQSMLMGTSGQGLNAVLGVMNLLADMMGAIGKINSAAMGVPGLLLLVGTFGYLKNAFVQAKAGLDAFIASLNGFTASVQAAQARQVATAVTAGAAPMIPMYLNAHGQMMGQMNPAFLATHTMGPLGTYIQNPVYGPPAPGPMTAIQKAKLGMQMNMTGLTSGVKNFFANMNPQVGGNVLSGSLMMAGAFAAQGLAQQQQENRDKKLMAENTRMQNMLGGAASGAMLGGIVGSLFPGIGNIVGTLTGTLLGGAVGFFTSPDPNKIETRALDENTKALNNATVAMTMLASSIIGAGPRAAGAVSAIELEMYMATRNNMMNTGLA